MHVFTRCSTNWVAKGSSEKMSIIAAATSGSSPSAQILWPIITLGSVHFRKWSRSLSPSVLLNQDPKINSNLPRPRRSGTESRVYSLSCSKTGLIHVCKSSFGIRVFDETSSSPSTGVVEPSANTSQRAKCAEFTARRGCDTSERNRRLTT